MHVEFDAPGIPRPKGSTRVVGHVRGRAIVRASNAPLLEPWCAVVAFAARAAMRKRGLTVRGDCGFRVGLTFRFPRPKSHVCRKGLRTSAPLDHLQKPDFDKLERAVFDALTGIVWQDDCQVVGHLPGDGKRWCEAGEEPGCLVRVEIVGREAA